MIEWKKYDPDNPPELDIYFLVSGVNEYYGDEDCTDEGKYFARVAKLANFNHYKTKEFVRNIWEEVMEGLSINGVTHYAEINPPEGDS